MAWNFSVMDHYTIPLLDVAAQQKDNREVLKEEKIEDQRKIIELQGKLIEKKEARNKISAEHCRIRTEISAEYG